MRRVIIYLFNINAVFSVVSNLRWPGIYQQLPSVNVSGPIPSMTMGSSRQDQSILGGYDTCFLVTLSTQNNSYSVQIDTGSSDTVLPHSSLKYFTGPRVEYDIPPGKSTALTSYYADGSWWKGYLARINIEIENTSIVATGPVALMTSQSIHPIFADGQYTDGLLGVAFPSLSGTTEEPTTLMDAWYEAGSIEKNEIGFHGCSYALTGQSWIDFGNDTPYSACGDVSVTVGIPDASYFNLNILDMAVDGVSSPLPGDWQQGLYSILDSCTSAIRVPESTLAMIQDRITKGKGLSKRLKAREELTTWLYGQIKLGAIDDDLIWEHLPVLSFTISSELSNAPYKNTTLILGPRQYIQKDRKGYWIFMIQAGSDRYSVLGLPFFSAFHVELDRTNHLITFKPGCGCETALDEYPLISIDGMPTICPPDFSAPTGSGNNQTLPDRTATNSSWTCKQYIREIPKPQVAVKSIDSSSVEASSNGEFSSRIRDWVPYFFVISDESSPGGAGAVYVAISLFLYFLMGRIAPLKLPKSLDEIPKADVSCQDCYPVNSHEKQYQGLSGGHSTCFLSEMIVDGVSFTMQVDSGSSDTVVAHTSLARFYGPKVSYSIPSGQEISVANYYGDTSWWKGYLARVPITLAGTTISATAPVALMTKQSTSPQFADGVNYDGLIGIGFPDLAVTQTAPQTIVDAFYMNGAIKKNEIAFHGCPYSLSNQSWMDIGNETPYSACGDFSVAVQLPEASYFTLDVTDISVGPKSISFSSSWQKNHYTILDSCTSNILLPKNALSELKSQIKNSGGLSYRLQNSNYLSLWLDGSVKLRLLDSDLTWSKLPTLNFTMASGMTVYKEVSLVLGPRQYIQPDSDGYYIFMVADLGSDDFAIMGLPFYTAYHIVMDRTNNLVKFQPGCGCESLLDRYPEIFTDGISNKCSPTITTNSTTNGTSTAWSCSTMANLDDATGVPSSTKYSGHLHLTSLSTLSLFISIVFGLTFI